jgi:hypothetical protein
MPSPRQAALGAAIVVVFLALVGFVPAVADGMRATLALRPALESVHVGGSIGRFAARNPLLILAVLAALGGAFWLRSRDARREQDLAGHE